MAGADYRRCDVCNGKVFYDANLNYYNAKADAERPPFRIAGEEPHFLDSMSLDYLGDWAVICTDCAKTHETIVRPRGETADLAALRASLAPVREKLETITRWHGYDRIHISKPMLELVNDALRLLAGLEG